MDLEPITVRDLPIAEKAGDVGIRQDRYGTWVPLGWNVDNYAAKVKKRREWEAEQRAGGRWSPSGLMIPVAKCSLCRIVIGRGYWEQEIYLWPTGFEQIPHPRKPQKKTTRPSWSFVCAHCATDDLGLSFGYCFVSQEDYTGPYAARLNGITAGVIATKRDALYDYLLPLWNPYISERKRAYSHEHGSLKGFPRLALFQEFAADQRPPVLTFATIHQLNEQKESSDARPAA